MSKHTPGPWRYEPETGTIRSVPANYWLATMDSFDEAVNHHANALLIEAAPEMLELLKNTAPILRQYIDEAGPCDHEVNFCVCWLINQLAEIQNIIKRLDSD